MIEKKIVFWGTGNRAKEFVRRHKPFMKNVKVQGFTNSHKIFEGGGGIEGYRIESPEVLLNQTYDYILILSSYYEEIKNLLTKQYSVPIKKILSIDDAYKMYVKDTYEMEGNKLQGLITEFAFSEQMYNKMLSDFNNMFFYLYIEDKYKDSIEEYIENLYSIPQQSYVETSKKQHTPIWICWLQGLENAPDIVNCCVNSIIENVEGEIHIITYDNFSEYVEIEDNILKKHKLGIIDRTHFSDIIRLALLCKYGGIWMDATLLMMDRGLPDYIYEYPLFMYKIRETLDRGYPDPRLFTNWFIKSEKGNPILITVYRIHEQWWKSENKIPYCFFHYVMRLVWNAYEKTTTGKIERMRLNIYNDNCRILVEMLNKRYDEVFWKNMQNVQPLQKLSWKSDYKTDGTFYEHIKKKYRRIER